ncbi:hypothetical protein [Fulvivirga imtechensis]|uniref:hypothetical protein n=1 Tax=Fulvivirga imtechensis TaxID=881893 RepID=UPI0002D3FA82|nr:hypothetical protein [Fulvivirga imtechensis]
MSQTLVIIEGSVVPAVDYEQREIKLHFNRYCGIVVMISYRFGLLMKTLTKGWSLYSF